MNYTVQNLFNVIINIYFKIESIYIDTTKSPKERTQNIKILFE